MAKWYPTIGIEVKQIWNFLGRGFVCPFLERVFMSLFFFVRSVAFSAAVDYGYNLVRLEVAGAYITGS